MKLVCEGISRRKSQTSIDAPQVVAEVLDPAQAPARTGEASRSHANLRAAPAGAAIYVALITYAGISDTIECDAGLSEHASRLRYQRRRF